MNSKTMRHTVSVVVAILAAALWCGFSTGAGPARPHRHSPPTNGMEATLTADQFVYTNTAGYAVCPACTTNVPPCELPCYFQPGTNATAVSTFQVTNASAKPRTFLFATSQQFEVELMDQNGAVVAAWSDGKAFAQIITTITFAPGETRSFD